LNPNTPAHAHRWFQHRLAPALFVVLTGISMSACAPLVLGTAVGGALVATDRRTSGAQLEDKGLNLKVSARIRDVLGNDVHINVNAYNRVILLTGEVPNAAIKEQAEGLAATTENTKSVINELAIAGVSSLSSRASDVWLQGKVKATLIDARDLQSNAFDIIVERSEVFLMGMVTEREADRAAALAASVKGVHKVVRLFHILTEDELAQKWGPAPTSGQSAETKAEPNTP
jgi:osmotically-inducible protein OsmY